MAAFLSLREVAEYLGTSTKTIYRLIKKGHLPAIKIGGDWRIEKSALDLYILNKTYFIGGSKISRLFFNSKVLEQYRRDPRYYVQESAYHGQIGSKEDADLEHRAKSLGYKNAIDLIKNSPIATGFFGGLNFWKVRLKNGSIMIVLDPRAFHALPKIEQSKWQAYRITDIPIG